MSYLLLPVLTAQLNKAAASRLDKEVAAGNVSYSDVDPRIPRPMGESGMAKRISRAGGMAATPRSPEHLERLRTLNAALFRNQHQENTLPQVPQTPRVAPGTPASMALHNSFMPGMGPATVGTSQKQHVYTPHDSGSFLRTADKGTLGRIRAVAASMQPNPVVRNALLLPRSSVDNTLNHAVLQHELGEADLVGSKNVTPFASHLGVQPITREQQALVGDPEAQKVMQGLRRNHPDDALVQRKLREAGATPDSPLPVEGRAARSVERNLAANPMALHKTTRNKALKLEIQRLMLDLARPEEMTGIPKQNYTTVPNDIKTQLRSGGMQVKDYITRAKDPAIKPLTKLKDTKQLYHNLKPLNAIIGKYVR